MVIGPLFANIFQIRTKLFLAMFGLGLFAQTSAKDISPIISFLLQDGVSACKAIDVSVGSSQLHHLVPQCRSVGRQVNQNIDAMARYFNFNHAGGALHIDAIGAHPQPYDVFIYLKQAPAENAAPGSGAEIDSDNNSHEDFRSARLTFDNLAAGDYQIEVTSTLADTEGRFNLSIYGNLVTAQETGLLADTGITISSRSSNLISGGEEEGDCDEFDSAGQQDCSFGPDRESLISGTNSSNDQDGLASRSYLRINSDGAPVTDSSPYACIKDNRTGLMWEIKQNSGLHKFDHQFTWYNTDSSTNGGGEGVADAYTACDGYDGNDASTFCNTEAFVNRVNNVGLCGYTDWRIPNRIELRSIVSIMRSPAIDPIFGNSTSVLSNVYWTAIPFSNQGEGPFGAFYLIHAIDFSNGSELFYSADIPPPRADAGNHIRLVRSD